MKKKKQKRHDSKTKRQRAMQKKGGCPVKKDVNIKTPEDRLLWKLVGVALMALAAFFAVALASYDWRAAMSEVPAAANGNLVGVVGNTK